MFGPIVQALQNAFADLPAHFVREKVIDIAHANERSLEHARSEIESARDGFVAAVWVQKHSEAIALCSRALREKLADDDAKLADLREFLLRLTDTKGKKFEIGFLRRSAHMSADGVYRERHPASLTFDFVLEDGEWKIEQFTIDRGLGREIVTLGELVKRVVTAVKGADPNGVPPSGRSCAAPYAIKGSRSGIYHLPGGRFYDEVTPVRCFATEAHAKAAGYRASQRG